MADDYGIKISKEGYDVKTASVENLIMTSASNLLKAKLIGTYEGVGTIAHGLSYVPIYISRTKGGTLERMSFNSNASIDSTNLNLEGSLIKKYYIFYQQAI